MIVASAITLVMTVPPAAAGEKGGELGGSVVRGGAAVTGILVEVHLEARGEGAVAPVAAVESGEDGSFVISMPAGEYYLAAKTPSSRPGPPVVVEHPGNPPLGIVATRFFQNVFRNDQNGKPRVDRQCGAKAGDPPANDEDVGKMVRDPFGTKRGDITGRKESHDHNVGG